MIGLMRRMRLVVWLRVRFKKRNFCKDWDGVYPVSHAAFRLKNLAATNPIVALLLISARVASLSCSDFSTVLFQYCC